MALPYEFVIAGPPVSQQTRRRARLRAWMQRVRSCASADWPLEEPPEGGAVQVTLTYLYDDVALDLDNLAKLILDALKGLIFFEDEQITDIHLRKRSLSRSLRIENVSPGMARGLALRVEFLHVLVEHAPDQEFLP